MIPIKERFEQWVDYTWEDSDTPIFCRVNLDLEEEIPFENYTSLCLIETTYPDNLDISKNYKLVEGAIISLIKNNKDFLYAGTIMSEVNQTFAIYSSCSAYIQDVISQLQSEFSNFNFTVIIEEDNDWEFYLETLYPSPVQMQNIINKKYLQKLEDQYPYLNTENKIFHWIIFNKKKEMENFKTKIWKLNFEVEMQVFDNKTSHFPHKIKISRIDKLNLKNINKITKDLFYLAENLNGEYDGWEI